MRRMVDPRAVLNAAYGRPKSRSECGVWSAAECGVWSAATLIGTTGQRTFSRFASPRAAVVCAGLLVCAFAPVAGAAIDFAPRLSVTTEDQPSVVAVADVTGDGIPDLLSGTALASDLILHQGLGDGTFASGVGIAVGESVQAIATGDFDEDGDRDILTANLDRSLKLLAMDGHGIVTSTTTLFVGGAPTAIVAGDLNGDGHVDLVTVNSESRNAAVLLGHGAAGFDRSTFIDIGDFAVDAVLADVTEDGRLDIVAAAQRPAGVTVTSGNGDGTFGRPTRLRAGVEPAALGVADFDRDGHLDIVIANTRSNEVTMQRGIGGGRFVAGRRSLTSNTPVALTLGDWNNDGLVDVATANSGSNDVSVFEGNGRGLFGTAQQFRVGRQPADLVSADATGDGSPDLIVANNGGASISILPSRALRQPGTAKRRIRCPQARLRAVSAVETRCVSLTMSPAQVTELQGRPKGARRTNGDASVQWNYKQLLVTFSRKLNLVTSIRTLLPGAHTANGLAVGSVVGNLEPKLDADLASCSRAGVTQTCSEFSLFTFTQYRVIRGRLAWIQVDLAAGLLS